MAAKNYFKALYKVAKLINSSLEPNEVLDGITKGVAEVMKVKASSLRLLDSSGKELRMGSSCGLSEGYLRKGKVLVSQSGLDKEALKGHTVYLEDARSDKRFQYGATAKKEGIVSVLVVPLMVGKKAVGVLRVYTARKRGFGEDDKEFLDAVGNLSALALEKARLHKALQTDYELLLAERDRMFDL
jgi:signal transduction protein with GAF and PtsI domain